MTVAKEMRVVKDVTCPFCGVTCDDLEVHVEDGKIRDVKNACVLGKDTFLHHLEGLATPRIDGKPASIEACIEAAADILARAKYPLIYGLDSTELHAHRKAIELADLIGANIDHTSSVCHAPSLQAVQTVGIPSCTVGEVKNRADLVIFWGANPAEAHPRHATRYSVTVKGMFTPQGRKDRTVIHIDVRRTPTSRMADTFIQIKPHSDYEVFSTLTALVNGHDLDVSEVGGVPLQEWRDLVEVMKGAKFGILYWGMGLTMTRGKYLNVVALLRLCQELNRFTKFLGAPLRGHGNVVGMAQVLTWQTGFPFAVNMSRGYPRFNPGEFSVADLLGRGEVDAALIIAADAIGNFPAKAAQHLKSIPLIAVDPKESETTKVAQVVIPAAQAAVAAEGVAYRMDHIPLPLKKVVDSPYPSDREILDRIIARVLAKRPDDGAKRAAPLPRG
ncbi:MAG: formyltransferase/hydrolase complex subunit beta (fhcB) [candidate division NC10 bacterium CSP1-5]|nr:MAG: formyltransferase/hydrolase complex subunit beta (fhcB) [candidate division NC10 bacterium CSP1-5]